MATYTYLACDLRTNQVLAELPLQVTSPFDSKLNGYGSLTADLNLNAKGLGKLDLPSICKGGRTALYVDRDGVLVWGGILWGGSRTRSDHKATLRALEFESYFTTRLVTQDYTPAGIDQFTIAHTLLNRMQAVPGGDIGVIVGSELSGVLRTRDYFRTSLQQVGEALRSLTTLEFGFDLMVTVAYDSSGIPRKYLRLGYPRLGRAGAASGFDFQSPGNITAWTDDFDAFTDSATDYYMLGEGQGSTSRISHASRPSDITAGYPVLERKSSDNRNVRDQTELDAHAREALTAAPIPVETFTCEVKADSDPVLGSYMPGDEARYRLYDDDWWKPNSGGTPTFDRYLRILQTSVDPVTDRVQHTLGGAR